MRVMQVIYSFGIGGSEMVARDIALGMRKDIVQAVAALEFDGPVRKNLTDAGVRTWVINKQPGEKIGAMQRLLTAMRDFQPDIVHTHHLYTLIYALPGAFLTGAHILHTEHEYYSLMTPKASFLLRCLSRFCRVVTAVNKDTSEFLIEKVGISVQKVCTVVNGINLNRYGQNCLDRVALGLSETDMVVGIVARLNQVKDHPMLLRAFRVVAEKQPQVRLLIIGDGPARQQLEHLTEELGLREIVKFLGMRTDVPELLSCVDIAVLSSREEGLPMCILEAMAASKPVVATDVGGVSLVVRHGTTGMLVSVGDSEAMASALLTLFADPCEATKMGRNGRKLVEQSYDLKKSITIYRELYERCKDM